MKSKLEHTIIISTHPHHLQPLVPLRPLPLGATHSSVPGHQRRRLKLDLQVSGIKSGILDISNAVLGY